jgi:hypothetical protein
VRRDATIDHSVISMCVNNIKLVHGELKDGRDKDIVYAKRLLRVSDRIYILGFGFAPVNVSRLGLSDFQEGKCAATAHGFTAHERVTLLKRCGGKVNICPEHNIESIFRELVQWD